MSNTVSFAEVAGQEAQLLPARTVLTLYGNGFGGAGGDGGDSNYGGDGHGGEGGDAYAVVKGNFNLNAAGDDPHGHGALDQAKQINVAVAAGGDGGAGFGGVVDASGGPGGAGYGGFNTMFVDHVPEGQAEQTEQTEQTEQ